MYNENVCYCCFSACKLLQEIEESKEIAGYQLKVKGRDSNVTEKVKTITTELVKKINIRYQDLSDEVLDATAIGNLKCWPQKMMQVTNDTNKCAI